MRRYSILFIDDEELIRESFLQLVDWEAHQFDVAGTFKNGETAWEYLKSHPVDIIITDINMPFMNGINLLEHIRMEKLKTRVLFLTGYEYFEYAHKAVQLQAFDFLLKPITTEKLLSAVERAAFDIEKEEAAAEAVGKSQELSRSNFINRMLYGKIKKENINKEAMGVGIPTEVGCYLVMMAAVDVLKSQKVLEGEIGESKRQLQMKILQKKDMLTEETGEHFELYFARNVSTHIQMVLAAQKKDVFNPAFIRMFIDRILELEKEELWCRITLAVGRSRRYIEELPESFKRVRHAVDNRHMLKGKGWKVIYASDSVQERKEEIQIVLPTDTFLHHIRMGMTEEVEADIKNIYEPFRHKKYISLESAKMVTTELAITAFKGEASSGDESVSYLYYLNHIQQLNTLDEMEDDILRFAVSIAEKRKKGGNHKKKIAEQALEYLKRNYNKEDLSLNDIAAFLNISVPYLAVLFKQETKQNFSAHLLEVRMEKAKELLRTTGYTVNEIAEQVGYNSSQYFAVCFKKYTGISPGVYRDQI